MGKLTYKNLKEVLFYVSVGAGMALATSSFTMISGLFEIMTGPIVIMAVVLGGLFCILIANSVAELARKYPSSPGIRTYIKVALGNKASLFFTYLYLIFLILIGGVESSVFVLVINTLFPGANPYFIILGLLITIMAINILGIELSKNMQILTTMTLILSISGMGLYGFLDSSIALPSSITAYNWQDSGIELLPAGMAMAIFLFIGFEWITPLGVSPDSYKRRVPISMPLAIVLNMIMYCLLVLGFNSQMTSDEIVSQAIPQVPYVTKLFGESGIYLAFAISILAIISTFNAGVMGGSRLIYGLTREGNLPKWCSKIYHRTSSPIGAILLLGSCVMVSSMITIHYGLELTLSTLGASIICFVYLALMISMLKIRYHEPATSRPPTNRIVVWLRWLVIVILPLMGIGVLFSIPDMTESLIYGFIAVTISSFFLYKFSMKRNASKVV